MPTPYIYKPYPAWRFHATLPDRIVKNAEEDAALGPGWGPAGAVPPQAPDSTPEQTSVPDAAPVVVDEKGDKAVTELGSLVPATGPASRLPTVEQIAADLYKTNGPELIERIESATDIEILELTRQVELVNPGRPGGRKGILRALEARIAVLKKG